METITLSQAFLILILFSFSGWLLKTALCSIRKKTYINPGFFYGPYCFAYGFSAVLLFYLSLPFIQNPFIVFCICSVTLTILAYFTGWLMESLFGARWWDYRNRRFHLKGRVCLSASIFYGISGLMAIYLFHPCIQQLVSGIRPGNQRALAFIGFLLIMADLAYTLKATKFRINAYISFKNDNRTEKETQNISVLDSFPHEPTCRSISSADSDTAFPAMSSSGTFYPVPERLGFYQGVWIFTIASIIGYLVETVYCLVKKGMIMSRQGMLYGPFCQIYGLGAILLILLLVPVLKKSRSDNKMLFIGGGLLGGAFEFVCSLAQESVFGSVSWNYSSYTMSIGGRTTFMYMVFWGILSVFFIKIIYPRLSFFIDKILKKQNILVTWILIAAMSINALLSGVAVYCWSQRQLGREASSSISLFMDSHYPDELMERIYPNMKFKAQ